MNIVTFNCTLLSDIVLNASGASEGQLPSHDFIPGSNFLGIVARKYKTAKEENIAYDLFHSGNVCFGDAHVLIDGQRSLKIPASWHYQKGKSLQDGIWLHNHMTTEQHGALSKPGIQLKQGRSGFFVCNEKTVQLISLADAKYYSMKSAYDGNKRRSMDEQLFGYTALRRGSEWQFSISLDEPDKKQEIIQFIKNNLAGERNVGRSRSAQYGRVKITCINEVEISPKHVDMTDDEVVLYAESRLAILDAFGQPTLQLQPDMFGFPDDSEIIWGKCQVLTSRYAPWNGIRKTRDTDRICIDKGSVIVVKTTQPARLTDLQTRAGFYKNEGFGVILINPDFLSASTSEGRLNRQIIQENQTKLKTGQIVNTQSHTDNSTVLLSWLGKKAQGSENNKAIFTIINDFRKKHGAKFSGKFSSQWGQIRAIAEQASDANDLHQKLFRHNRIPAETGYLMHGVATTKWRQRGRREAFKELLECSSINEEIKVRLVIRLAAEMAKNSL